MAGFQTFDRGRISAFANISEGTATSAATKASHTGWLNPMDLSAASGNGNQLTRTFGTLSGIGVTEELTEERRYFASGKSLSEPNGAGEERLAL